MGITTYNPTSPGRRNSTVNDFAELTKHTRPEKSLCERLAKHGGRNHHGRITSRHRGGGARRTTGAASSSSVPGRSSTRSMREPSGFIT